MTLQVNKPAIARAFSRAARNYDQFAQLQRYSGEALMALLPALPAGRVLDAGCGTGWFSRQWRQRGHQVLALDLSPAMLKQAQRNNAADYYLRADIERLPVAAGGIDLVFSNLAIQWCSNVQNALQQLVAVTRPAGLVAFSLPLQGSLIEVNQAWQRVGSMARVNSLPDRSQIEVACQLWDVRLRIVNCVQAFTSARQAMQSLKGVGASWQAAGNQTRLSRQRLVQLEQVWPQDSRGYLLSWQLILGVITA